MQGIRTQLILASSTIVLVIVLGAVTGFVALRSSLNEQTRARGMDEQLVALGHLRDNARELAASARRYMISGDAKERQRVLAIMDDVSRDRQVVAHASALQADLDAYQVGLLQSISVYEDDPIARLEHFEDQLARIRAPLGAALEEIMTAQRDERARLRTAHGLARDAQWTLVLASAIGVMLAIGICVTVLRLVPRPVRADPSPPEPLPSEDDPRDEPAVLR